MKAVILAAGKSTRTHPLTITRPKPLLKVVNKTLLQHNLEQLEGLIDEAIVVIGFEGEQIEEHLGANYRKIKISYVEQKQQLGTGHALVQAEDAIKDDKFLVMMGDDLYSREDIKRCLKHKWCVLAKRVEDPSPFGVWVTKEDRVSSIVEKPKKPVSNLANTGLYVLGKEIFPVLKKLKKTSRGEYEVVDAISSHSKAEEIMCEEVQDYWLPIPYPWSLLEANEFLLKRLNRSSVEGTVESGANLKGRLILGRGSIIKAGSYIEGHVAIGENCVIGPNTVLRERGAISIGDNCKLINTEVINSIVMDNTNIHRSYVGDSVIGYGCNFGAGTVTANLRHDGKNIKSQVKGKMVDSGRRKLGVIAGDDVKTGINTSIYPGRKIWPGKTTHPVEAVKKDLV